MKKINCNVIRDILPLYIENVVSADTKNFVEKHLSECESCKDELKILQTPIELAIDNDTRAFKNIKKKWNRKKLWVSIITTVIVTVLFISGLLLYHLELPVNYSETQIWTEEVTMQGGLKSFQVNILGPNIEMVEVPPQDFSAQSHSTLHYRVFRTTFLRNIFTSADRMVAVGVPEYWHEIDNFESTLVIEFADKSLIYRNGQLME